MNIDGGLRALNDARQLHVAAAGEAARESAHSSVSKVKGSHTWARAEPGSARRAPHAGRRESAGHTGS